MINQISFKNFKCFEDVEIPINHLTVLTGVNGMGKSTITQGILALRQSYLSNGLKEGLELSGKYVDLGYGKDILFEKASADLEIGISLKEDGVFFPYSFMYTPNLRILERKGEIRIANILQTKNFLYLSADRIIPNLRYNLGNVSDVENRDFGKRGEFAIQYIDLEGGKKAPQENSIDIKNEIEKWLQTITPGVSPAITVNQDMSYSDLRFQFREGNYKTSPYRAINVGFGLTYILPVITALVTAKNGDFLIIENPEAHVHPAGQRKMGELIAQASNRGAQIIIETHSDHIVNGIRISVRNGLISKENVEFAYFFRNSETFRHEVVYPQIDEKGRFDYWPVGFFDQWDEALLELI